MAKEQEDIEALVHKYATHVNERNAVALAALYATDGGFMPNGYSTIKGRASIEKSAGTKLGNAYFRIQYEVQNVSIMDNVAIVDAIAQTVTDESGNNLHAKKSRDLFVFKHSENGWQIARYIFNNLTA